MTGELKAGRELDALVAEKVMGVGVEWWNGEPLYVVTQDGHISSHHLAEYSTDIAAAWEVAEKLRADGLEISVHNSWPYNDGRRWCCDIMAHGKWDNAKAETAPLAICLAALKAIVA
jgi:hypothetical protein